MIFSSFRGMNGEHLPDFEKSWGGMADLEPMNSFVEYNGNVAGSPVQINTSEVALARPVLLSVTDANKPGAKPAEIDGTEILLATGHTVRIHGSLEPKAAAPKAAGK